MSSRNLKYYLGLNYDIIVRKVEQDGEVIYTAFTRELDRLTFYGTGDSRTEAIDSLEHAIEELFPYYLDKGFEIPEPIRDDEQLPSGRFLLRTTPTIHRRLIDSAKRNGQSLNQYVNSILDSYCTADKVLGMADKKLDDLFARYKYNLQLTDWWPPIRFQDRRSDVDKRQKVYSEAG